MTSRTCSPLWGLKRDLQILIVHVFHLFSISVLYFSQCWQDVWKRSHLFCSFLPWRNKNSMKKFSHCFVLTVFTFLVFYVGTEAACPQKRSSYTIKSKPPTLPKFSYVRCVPIDGKQPRKGICRPLQFKPIEIPPCDIFTEIKSPANVTFQSLKDCEFYREIPTDFARCVTPNGYSICRHLITKPIPLPPCDYSRAEFRIPDASFRSRESCEAYIDLNLYLKGSEPKQIKVGAVSTSTSTTEKTTIPSTTASTTTTTESTTEATTTRTTSQTTTSPSTTTTSTPTTTLSTTTTTTTTTESVTGLPSTTSHGLNSFIRCEDGFEKFCLPYDVYLLNPLSCKISTEFDVCLKQVSLKVTNLSSSFFLF